MRVVRTVDTDEIVLSERNILALVTELVRGNYAAISKRTNDGRGLILRVEKDSIHYDRITGRS